MQLQHPPNAMVTGNLEGGRLPSSWRSRLSSSDVRREDDRSLERSHEQGGGRQW